MVIKTYREQMREAIEESKASGKRVRKVFSREKFMREFPQSAADPRMAFTPQDFVIDVTPLEKLTVGELRELCLANRNKPIAIQKALSIEGMKDTDIVRILREDYQALKGEVVKTTKMPPAKKH